MLTLEQVKKQSREWEEGGENRQRRKVYMSLIAAKGNRTETGLIWGE